MSEHQPYLSKARAALARTLPPAATPTPGNTPITAEPPVPRSGDGSSPRGDAYERNERYEKSSDSADTASGPAPLVLARLRAAVSERLRHWDDERLIVLADWHLALAFERGGASGFRRYLPRSLAGLMDDDLADLVDWPSLATLEKVLWASDPDAAERLGSGAQRLAGWWNAWRHQAGSMKRR